MGEILGAFIMPHPPIIIPEVGRGDEKGAIKTVEAMNRAGKRIAELRPDTIILTSPHGPVFQDYIYMSFNKKLRGDMGQFRQPQFFLEYENNLELAGLIASEANKNGILAGGLEQKLIKHYKISQKLDHGALVPLYHVDKYYSSFKLVHISIAGLSRLELYRFGSCIGQAVGKSKDNIVFIASGDLSHRLKEDGPYGYTREGVEFDRRFVNIMESGNIEDLMNIDPDICEGAGECGLRSFIMMLGALDGLRIKPELYSYEGPFGVGYGVAEINILGKGEERNSLEKVRDERCKLARENEDPYVKLARKTIETFVNSGRVIKPYENLPHDMLNNKAGTFVSLKIDGRLRGCIGTISSTSENIAEEIIQNAVSSCSRDPRFEPVSRDELMELTYSVDILQPAEPVSSINELDEKKYGVIVTSGYRRGLLLPNLEGVDTPEQQILIALQKAGIQPDEKYGLERFEVIRHI